MFSHLSKFVYLVMSTMRLLFKERPLAMFSAVTLLFASANLEALGILLMAYPFSSLPEGSESIELLMNSQEFRNKISYCFGGAILLFFVGASTVVWSIRLAVNTGRITSLKLGEKIKTLIKNESTIELACLEQELLKSGGLEQLTRRSLRALVRASFLLPRIIGFSLTALVGFGAVMWISPSFGLFSLIGLAVISVPLYMMNRGVLRKVPVMERSMKRSQQTIVGLFKGNVDCDELFDNEGDFATSLSIMGHLMTVRYQAGVIRSVFMSVCLIAIGAYMFMFETFDLGLIIPLLLALKLFAGSLQGIMRMSTGVSRTLVDATPTLFVSSCANCNNPGSSFNVPLSVKLEEGEMPLSTDRACLTSGMGVSSCIAQAMVLARVIDRDGRPVPCDSFSKNDIGFTITTEMGEFTVAPLQGDVQPDLIATIKTVSKFEGTALKSVHSKSSLEEELELELDMN